MPRLDLFAQKLVNNSKANPTLVVVLLVVCPVRVFFSARRSSWQREHVFVHRADDPVWHCLFLLHLVRANVQG